MYNSYKKIKFIFYFIRIDSGNGCDMITNNTQSTQFLKVIFYRLE